MCVIFLRMTKVKMINLEQEKTEINRKYRKLLRKAKPFLKDDDAQQIRKAFDLSLEAHRDMRRKSGDPYIYHPLSVAEDNRFKPI